MDGSRPTKYSSVFTGPIEVNRNMTLKFIAIDPADDHKSDIVTEKYIIDAYSKATGLENASSPSVTSTKPENGATRIDPRSVINATFSEPMDASTIDETTFTIRDETGNQIAGTVDYDPSTNTASFTSDPFDRSCSECLNVGRTYTATLDASIQDEAGNALTQDVVWSFMTGGAFTIEIGDVVTTALIGGSAFEITPDPFDLDGSLLVQDNGEHDLDGFFFGEEPLEGRITLFNVEFETYTLVEVSTPDDYQAIYENLVVTVHETQRAGLVTVENLPSSTSLDDIPPVLVPAPDLTATQFELYQGNATIGDFSGIQGSDLSNPSPVFSVAGDQLPNGAIATLNTIDELPRLRTLVFDITAPGQSTAQDLFDTFDIPTYPNPEEQIADDTIYHAPAFAIPYEDSGNNFILIPRIAKIFPSMTLLLNQSSFVESQIAVVRNLNMTFAVQGNNIGFSFGITDIPPPGTPEPPLDAPALFLDVGFVGDVDFSDPAAFQSSPKIDILVNKTLPGFPELPNGCPDFRLLFFDGTNWVEVQKLNPTGNFTDFCPFTLEPEHFSKFAVGGVKGQTVSVETPPSNDDSEQEERSGRAGGGGSRSTAVTSTPPGNDVETTLTTRSGTVTLEFESVEAGSGQLRVDSNQVSEFEEIFDDIVIMAQDNDEHAIVTLEGATYSTAGGIFDIDASEVNYQGKVGVTIPYDERTVTLLSGSESNVKFLHYDEETGVWQDATSSVDDLANTVTGILDSLSPVVAAVIINQGVTFDEKYFEENPLARLGVTSASFSVSTESEVVLSATLNNMQGINQEYFVVVQILDENGIAQFIEWEKGSLVGGGEGQISMIWKPEVPGAYEVQVFVWDNADNPSALSDAILKDVVV